MPLPIVGLSALLKALSDAKHHQQLPEEPFTPFDLSHLRHRPTDIDQPAHAERRRTPQSGVYAPPVPNN